MKKTSPPSPLSALFKNVRWLSIKEIAEHWSPEIGIPASLIERELCLSLINMPRLREGHDIIQEFPTGKLPPVDTPMTKIEIEKFCEKQGHWPLPKFWFDEAGRSPSFPGRPSIMSAIVQQLEQTAAANELKGSLAEQARQLEKWAIAAHPGIQTPKAKAIENAVRDVYRQLRSKTEGH